MTDDNKSFFGWCGFFLLVAVLIIAALFTLAESAEAWSDRPFEKQIEQQLVYPMVGTYAFMSLSQAIGMGSNFDTDQLKQHQIESLVISGVFVLWIALDHNHHRDANGAFVYETDHIALNATGFLIGGVLGYYYPLSFDGKHVVFTKRF